MDNKKVLLMIFFGMFLVVGFILLVMAALGWDDGIQLPEPNTNHSDVSTGFLVLNFTYTNGSEADTPKNATFWYNVSGTWTYLANGTCVFNLTAGNSSCSNHTINTTTLQDGFYTINVTFDNYTGGTIGINTANMTENITIDNTPPNVTTSNFNFPANDTNHSANIITLNVTLTDDTSAIETVILNVTKGTDYSNNGTYTATRVSGTNDWTVALNLTDFADGHYNITAWVNDTVNNLNYSAVVSNITFDQTAPAVALTRESETKISINMNISVSDSLSSAALSSCSVSVDKVGTSNTFSGTGATQTLLSTGLSCSTTYKYTVTCNDRAGNSGSDTESFTTDPCGGGISPGGGTSTGAAVVWTNTYVIADEQFEQGVTKELKAEERVKVKVGVATHYIGVKSMTGTSATIEIASNPVSVTLDVGEEAKVDVDTDGIYDIYVKLNAILNGKADVLVQKISEAVPAGEGSVSTTGEIGETVGKVSWWTKFIDWLKGLFGK